MSYSYYLRKTCRFCGAAGIASNGAAIPLVDTPPGDKYVPPERKDEVRETVPLDILFCESCGGMQTSAVVDPEFLYRHYLSRPAAVNQGLSDAYHGYAEDILRRFARSKNSLAVEAGSNDGMFAKFLQDRGMRTVGVEPARNLAEQATAAGVETIGDFFSTAVAEKIKDEKGAADVVIANHMFANVDDAGAMLEAVKAVLAPEGVMTLQTFYMADVLEKKLCENFNHEHLSYFYITALRRFLERHDLELFEVQRVPAKGGSIRCFIQRKGGSREIDASVEAQVAHEAALGMNDPETYGDIGRFIAGIREPMQNLLGPVKEAGRRVAAYGTSIGATTFTYQYGLGDVIDYYIDDDPYRQGLVSPGYNIPVVSNAALAEQRPDYVIVLAPLYADQIMRKNQAYKDGGGTFVKIWPQFEVI